MQLKTVYLGFIVVSLASCATQPPAVVVDGYNTGRSLPEASSSDDFVLSVVESSDLSSEPLASNEKMYRVQDGDKLSQIAAFFHIDEDELLAHNRLVTAEQVKSGTVLKIPTKQLMESDVSTADADVSVNKMLDAKLASTQSGPYRLTDRFEKKEATAAVKKTEVRIPTQITKHTVKAGENIFRIGLKYNVSQFDIINANDGVNPADLRIGQQLIIPMKGTTAPVEVAKKPEAPVQKKVVKAEPKPTLKQSKKLTLADYKGMVKQAPKVRIPRRGMMWPVKGKLLKTYGNKERGVTHSGINIAVSKHTPIRAADGGKVIYSDNGLEQYGNLILIRHNNGYVTAYAHNAYNHVKRNKWVKKGDVIALAGTSGSVENPQLHFEVRKNAQAINPLKVLPK